MTQNWMKTLTMKLSKAIHPNRKTEDSHNVPTREGPNDYQYYRSFDNGWHLSVICNYGVRDYEEGYFEIGVWTDDEKSRFFNKGAIVIGTRLEFVEVAIFLGEFYENPEKAVDKRYIEIEKGI